MPKFSQTPMDYTIPKFSEIPVDYKNPLTPNKELSLKDYHFQSQNLIGSIYKNVELEPSVFDILPKIEKPVENPEKQEKTGLLNLKPYKPYRGETKGFKSYLNKQVRKMMLANPLFFPNKDDHFDGWGG